MKTKNLTFKEAFESGKPFKRLIWSDWYKASSSNKNLICKVVDGFGGTSISVIDALADDYILQTLPREIWVNEYNGSLLAMAHASVEEAKQSAEMLGVEARSVRFIEVLEVEE